MTDSDLEAWLDEFVNQTIENWVTMNSRPTFREDLIEHCLRLGAEAALAKSKGEKLNCVAGCKYYSYRETYHHKDCPHYSETMSKMYDDLKQKAEKLAEALARWLAWYGEDQGAKTIDGSSGDQGALDIVFGRQVLKEYRGE